MDMSLTPAQPKYTLFNIESHFVTPLDTVPPSYVTSWIKGDGDCMFRAFTEALNLGLDHQEVRRDAVDYMRDHPEKYRDFIPLVRQDGQHQTWEDYLSQMSQDGTWGDNLALDAMCRMSPVHVFVLKKGDRGWTWLEVGEDCHTCFWLYLHNNHYENLLAQSQLL